MNCRFKELCCKQVINVRDGTCLGCVCDVEVDTKCAQVIALVVFGRLKCFGLLGREDDIIIPWRNINVIGEDTILVNCEPCRGRARRKNKFMEWLFG